MKKISWSPPEITEEDKKSMIDVINSEWLSEGKITETFEEELAKYLGCKHAIVVNNATSALTTALFAHGIKNGNEVIVPAYTFIATVNTPWGVGATPVLSDCDTGTIHATPDFMKSKITKKTTAIMPVDVAGMPIDVGAFEDFAEDNELIIIEDAAEALGARYKNRPLGSFNHTSIFSFQIAKICTTIEGGCITTNDDAVAEKCRMIKNHGALKKQAKTSFNYFGFNFRTTDVQSAFGISQLKRANNFLDHRKNIARIYTQELERYVNFQHVPEYVTTHARMFFPIFVDPKKRDKINEELNKNGIETRICWPPVHKQPYHSAMFPNQRYPNAENVWGSIITIPMGNKTTEDEAMYVVGEVKRAVNK